MLRIDKQNSRYLKFIRLTLAEKGVPKLVNVLLIGAFARLWIFSLSQRLFVVLKYTFTIRKWMITHFVDRVSGIALHFSESVEIQLSDKGLIVLSVEENVRLLCVVQNLSWLFCPALVDLK